MYCVTGTQTQEVLIYEYFYHIFSAFFSVLWQNDSNSHCNLYDDKVTSNKKQAYL